MFCYDRLVTLRLKGNKSCTFIWVITDFRASIAFYSDYKALAFI